MVCLLLRMSICLGFLCCLFNRLHGSGIEPARLLQETAPPAHYSKPNRHPLVPQQPLELRRRRIPPRPRHRLRRTQIQRVPGFTRVPNQRKLLLAQRLFLYGLLPRARRIVSRLRARRIASGGRLRFLGKTPLFQRQRVCGERWPCP